MDKILLEQSLVLLKLDSKTLFRLGYTDLANIKEYRESLVLFLNQKIGDLIALAIEKDSMNGVFLDFELPEKLQGYDALYLFSLHSVYAEKMYVSDLENKKVPIRIMNSKWVKLTKLQKNLMDGIHISWRLSFEDYQ